MDVVTVSELLCVTPSKERRLDVLLPPPFPPVEPFLTAFFALVQNSSRQGLWPRTRWWLQDGWNLFRFRALWAHNLWIDYRPTNSYAQSHQNFWKKRGVRPQLHFSICAHWSTDTRESFHLRWISLNQKDCHRIWWHAWHVCKHIWEWFIRIEKLQCRGPVGGSDFFSSKVFPEGIMSQ